MKYDVYGRLTEVKEWNGSALAAINDTNANGFIDASEYFDGSLTKNPYLFQGQRYDEETGLYYFKNRYYDPIHGRFISRDPEGMVDGPNLYAFVNNNPINYTDPLGLYGRRVHHDLTYSLAIKAGFSPEEAEQLANLDQGVDDQWPAWRGTLMHILNARRLRKANDALLNAIRGEGEAWKSKNAANALPETTPGEQEYKKKTIAEAEKDVQTAERRYDEASTEFKFAWDVEIDAAQNNFKHFPRRGGEGPTIRSGKKGNIIDVVLEWEIHNEMRDYKERFERFGELLHTVQDSFAHEGGEWKHPGLLWFIPSICDNETRNPVKTQAMVLRTLYWLLEFRKSRGDANVPSLEDANWKEEALKVAEDALGMKLPR